MPYLGGFKNPFRKEYIVVNLSDLKVFEVGEQVSTQTLATHGLIRASQTKGMLKVLGNGKLDRALSVKAHKVSASAREAIEQAGGSVSIIPMRQTVKTRRSGNEPPKM
jgi:large subunit ribosomal protein L15